MLHWHVDSAANVTVDKSCFRNGQVDPSYQEENMFSLRNCERGYGKTYCLKTLTPNILALVNN